MSSPGFFLDDADYAKQRMAASLMAPQNQGAFGGLANAGSTLAGAYAMKQLQDPANQGQQFMRQRMAAAGTPMDNNSWLGQLFSLGGGA